MSMGGGGVCRSENQVGFQQLTIDESTLNFRGRKINVLTKPNSNAYLFKFKIDEGEIRTRL